MSNQNGGVEPADPPGPYPSLDLVRAELDVDAASLEKRTGSVDTKAGLILVFSGVLVGLTKDAKLWVFVAGQIVAVVAACFAIGAFLPRRGKGINPQALRDKYLTASPGKVKLVFLDTRLKVHGEDEQALNKRPSACVGQWSH